MLHSCLCPIECVIVFAGGIDEKSLGHSAFRSRQPLHCLVCSPPNLQIRSDGGCCPFHQRVWVVSEVDFFSPQFLEKNAVNSFFPLHCLLKWVLTLTSHKSSTPVSYQSWRFLTPSLHFLLLFRSLPVKQKGFHHSETSLLPERRCKFAKLLLNP